MDYLALRHFDDKLDTVIALLRDLAQKGEIMSAELDSLKTAVNNCTTIGDSAVTLIQGLAAQIASLKTDPAALQALSDKLNAEAAAWKAAVEANTPAQPTPAPPAGAPRGSAR